MKIEQDSGTKLLYDQIFFFKVELGLVARSLSSLFEIKALTGLYAFPSW